MMLLRRAWHSLVFRRNDSERITEKRDARCEEEKNLGTGTAEHSRTDMSSTTVHNNSSMHDGATNDVCLDDIPDTAAKSTSSSAGACEHFESVDDVRASCSLMIMCHAINVERARDERWHVLRGILEFGFSSDSVTVFSCDIGSVLSLTQVARWGYSYSDEGRNYPAPNVTTVSRRVAQRMNDDARAMNERFENAMYVLHIPPSVAKEMPCLDLCDNNCGDGKMLIAVAKETERANREFASVTRLIHAKESQRRESNPRAFRATQFWTAARPFLCLPVLLTGTNQDSKRSVMYSFAAYGSVFNYLSLMAWVRNQRFLCTTKQIASPCEQVYGSNEHERNATAYFETTWLEIFVCQVAWQLLRALRFLHSINYAHRDVKPENVYVIDSNYHLFWHGKWKAFLRETPFAWVALGDWEFLCHHNPESRFDGKRSGSKNYAPFEAFVSPANTDGPVYNPMRGDIWSLGVTVYTLLTGRFVCKSGFLTEKPLYESCFPAGARDFIESCCISDPNCRPTAVELMDHDWFKQYGCFLEVYENTSSFNANSGVRHRAASANAEHIARTRM